jgi:hypothetical protein
VVLWQDPVRERGKKTTETSKKPCLHKEKGYKCCVSLLVGIYDLRRIIKGRYEKENL